MYNLRSTASRQTTGMEHHTGEIRMEPFCTIKDVDLWLDIRRFVLGKKPKSLHDTVKYARTTQAIANCDNSPIAAIQEQLTALELKMEQHHALVNNATPQAWIRVRDHSRGRPPRDYRVTRTPEPVPYGRDHSASYVSSSSPCHYKNQRTLPNHKYAATCTSHSVRHYFLTFQQQPFFSSLKLNLYLWTQMDSCYINLFRH